MAGAVPRCIYTDPEVAAVGLTEAQAREQYGDANVVTGQFPYAALARAAMFADRTGFVKTIHETRYGELLGVVAVGMQRHRARQRRRHRARRGVDHRDRRRLDRRAPDARRGPQGGGAGGARPADPHAAGQEARAGEGLAGPMRASGLPDPDAAGRAGGRRRRSPTSCSSGPASSRQIGAGLWSFLPLGWRVALPRMMQIIREEMDAIGGQEMLLPVLHPAEIWRRSGRYDIDAELFKLQDRVGRDLVLAMTHEEIIAFHAADGDPLATATCRRSGTTSRPRSGTSRARRRGVLRTREFIMKDSYTLDRDRAGPRRGLRQARDRLRRASSTAPACTWLQGRVRRRHDGRLRRARVHGAVAGRARTASRSPRTASYAANVEIAVSVAHPPDVRRPTRRPRRCETPGVGTIAELARSTSASTSGLTVKAVIVVPEDEQGGVVLALVRGDHRVHDLKLAKALGAPFRAGHAGGDPRRRSAPTRARSARSASREGAVREILADEVLREGAYVAGANRTGWHLRNVRLGRDYQARVADIRFAEEGELSVGTRQPRCASSRRSRSATSSSSARCYSETFGATLPGRGRRGAADLDGLLRHRPGAHPGRGGRAVQRRARHRLAARRSRRSTSGSRRSATRPWRRPT